MRLIRDLEHDARGPYTGAIGFAAPGGRAQFNVAIRTAVVDRTESRVTYGVGGGIVWDSDAESEFEETRAKAAILQYRVPDFDLLETMRWGREESFFLLDEHLDRMGEAAEFFGYHYSAGEARLALISAEPSFHAGRMRVRLTCDRSGRFRVMSTALEPAPFCEQPAVAIAAAASPSADPFLRYKTTHRAAYTSMLAASPEADDVILWNERGELTETCFGNLFLEDDGVLMTPALQCGLLPGTLRAQLIAEGRAHGTVLRPSDLKTGKTIWVGNSVRGLYKIGRLLTAENSVSTGFPE